MAEQQKFNEIVAFLQQDKLKFMQQALNIDSMIKNKLKKIEEERKSEDEKEALELEKIQKELEANRQRTERSEQ